VLISAGGDSRRARKKRNKKNAVRASYVHNFERRFALRPLYFPSSAGPRVARAPRERTRAAPGRTLLEMAAPSGMATTEKLDLVKLNSKVVAYLARHEARDKLCR